MKYIAKLMEGNQEEVQGRNVNPKFSQSMFGSDEGDDPGAHLGDVQGEYDGTLTRSRECGLGVRHQRHGCYYNLAVRLTPG